MGRETGGAYRALPSCSFRGESSAVCRYALTLTRLRTELTSVKTGSTSGAESEEQAGCVVLMTASQDPLHPVLNWHRHLHHPQSLAEVASSPRPRTSSHSFLRARIHFVSFAGDAALSLCVCEQGKATPEVGDLRDGQGQLRKRPSFLAAAVPRGNAPLTAHATEECGFR